MAHLLDLCRRDQASPPGRHGQRSHRSILEPRDSGSPLVAGWKTSGLHVTALPSRDLAAADPTVRVASLPWWWSGQPQWDPVMTSELQTAGTPGKASLQRADHLTGGKRGEVLTA